MTRSSSTGCGSRKKKIRSQMHRDGRRRHEPTSTTTPTTTTTTTITTTGDDSGVSGVSVAAITNVGNRKDEAKFKNKFEGYAATKSSSLRRRRSVRIPGEESGITHQVSVSIDRYDNDELGELCAISERSIGADMMRSLERDSFLHFAYDFC